MVLLMVLGSTMFTSCSRPRPEKVEDIIRGRLRCTEFVQRRQVNNYWWEVFVDDSPSPSPTPITTNSANARRAEISIERRCSFY